MPFKPTIFAANVFPLLLQEVLEVYISAGRGFTMHCRDVLLCVLYHPELAANKI